MAVLYTAGKPLEFWKKILVSISMGPWNRNTVSVRPRDVFSKNPSFVSRVAQTKRMGSWVNINQSKSTVITRRMSQAAHLPATGSVKHRTIESGHFIPGTEQLKDTHGVLVGNQGIPAFFNLSPGRKNRRQRHPPPYFYEPKGIFRTWPPGKKSSH